MHFMASVNDALLDAYIFIVAFLGWRWHFIVMLFISTSGSAHCNRVEILGHERRTVTCV
jgi:hypothetical protein